MTGYQKAKITGLWLKSNKALTLDEFAATIDVANLDKIKPPTTDLGKIKAVFGDVKVIS